jgi:hypothetical protein
MVEGDRDAEAPSDSAGGASPDGRAVAAWRAWLSALASNAEAALAAAMTYGALEEAARDAWLDALDADRAEIDVPVVALYAPLLAVETDAARRARIEQAMGAGLGKRAPATTALRATTASGDVVCAVATPLYLEFVELLVCRYRPDHGVVSAHHDPFRHESQVEPAVLTVVPEPIVLERAPLRVVIEELAHAVVADRRDGRAAPPELARFADLFGPDLDEEEDCPAA